MANFSLCFDLWQSTLPACMALPHVVFATSISLAYYAPMHAGIILLAYIIGN